MLHWRALCNSARPWTKNSPLFDGVREIIEMATELALSKYQFHPPVPLGTLQCTLCQWPTRNGAKVTFCLHKQSLIAWANKSLLDWVQEMQEGGGTRMFDLPAARTWPKLSSNWLCTVKHFAPFRKLSHPQSATREWFKMKHISMWNALLVRKYHQRYIWAQSKY